MAHPTRSTFRKLLGFVLLGTSVFFLLEVSARIYLFGFAGLIPAKINSTRGLTQTEHTRLAPVDSGLVFELKPNRNGLFKLAPFRTNSRGLRDREYEIDKPERTFRVVVLGSSFALPAGVAIEAAFHSLLEERLSEKFAPTRYEFINFAVGMYNPGQILATLEQRALAYDPDLILVTMTRLSMPWMVNGPAAAFSGTNGKPSQEAIDAFRRSYPILRSYFYLLVRQRSGLSPEPGRLRLGSLERVFMALMDGGEPPRRRESTAAPNERRARTEPAEGAEDSPSETSAIVRLARIGERSGVPVALVRLEFDASERQPIDLEAERLAHAHGVHYLDTRDAFAGTRPSDFWIYELDPHPNPAAHEIFAAEIEAFLGSEGLLPQ